MFDSKPTCRLLCSSDHPELMTLFNHHCHLLFLRGTGSSNCTSCDAGSALYLSNDGRCTATCPTSYYADITTQQCTPCTPCKNGTQYAVVVCQGNQNARCADVSTCVTGEEFEVQPPSATSDRQCKGQQMVDEKCIFVLVRSRLFLFVQALRWSGG